MRKLEFFVCQTSLRPSLLFLFLSLLLLIVHNQLITREVTLEKPISITQKYPNQVNQSFIECKVISDLPKIKFHIIVVVLLTIIAATHGARSDRDSGRRHSSQRSHCHQRVCGGHTKVFLTVDKTITIRGIPRDKENHRHLSYPIIPGRPCIIWIIRRSRFLNISSFFFLSDGGLANDTSMFEPQISFPSSSRIAATA